MSASSRLLRLGALCACLVPASLPAQGVGSEPSASSVVALPEFSVKSDPDNGYIASESVTGTRVAMPIKDLTFNVNVITSEFLDDFAFFELDSSFGYTSTLNSFDQTGNYNLRGYGANNNRRDGFFRVGLIDKASIDRIEVMKGPVAVSYGETAPSGILNSVSKQPKTTPSQSISTSVGSYDTTRVDVSSTGPLVGNTYYALNGAYYQRNYDAPFSELRNKVVALALAHSFGANAKLRLNADYMLRGQNSAQRAVPYLYNGSTYLGLSLNYPALLRLNHSGPDSFANRTIYNVIGIYEQRFNSVWSLRSGGSWYHRTTRSFNTGSYTQYNPATNLLSGRGTPAKAVTAEDGGGAQVDLSARYKVFNDRVELWSTVTGDYATYWRYGETNALPRTSSTPGDPYYFRTSVPLNAIDYSVPVYSRTLYSSLTQWLHNRVDTWGSFARQQFAVFDHRLIGMFGGRLDRTTYNLSQRDTSTPAAGAFARYSVKQTSPMAGLNYKVVPNIALYANWSRAFDPTSQGKRAAGDRQVEHSRGYDYGVKTGFFQDRLQFTLGGFYIERIDVSVTDLDPATGQIVTLPDGSYLSRGIELDGTWRIGAGLTSLFSYAHTDSRQANAGRDIDAVGRPPATNPKDSGSFALKYSFGGALKGLSINAGVIAQSFSYAVTGTSGATFDSRTGVYLRNNNQRNIKIPGFTTFEAGLRYRLSSGRGFGQTFGLNVKNLSDKLYLTSARMVGDSRSIYFSYTLSHR